MIFRPLFPNGPKVSVIGIGTHQFSGEWGKSFSLSEVQEIISYANDTGVNLIDTAPNYGNHLSEKLIGKSIGKNRKDWFIATKFGISMTDKGKENYNYTIDAIAKQLDKSLKSLETDYIDLYQFHSGFHDDFFNEDLWDYLSKQVEKGKVRFLGNSISNDLVKSGDDRQLEASQKYGISTIQIVYNRLSKEAEKNFLPLCKKYKLGALARVPLAKGILSGKYNVGHVFDKNDHRNKFNYKLNQKLIKEAHRIKDKEVDTIKMSQWAIAWCLKNKLISAVIPGCKNLKQLKDNVKSWKLL